MYADKVNTNTQRQAEVPFTQEPPSEQVLCECHDNKLQTLHKQSPVFSPPFCDGVNINVQGRSEVHVPSTQELPREQVHNMNVVKSWEVFQYKLLQQQPPAFSPTYSDGISPCSSPSPPFITVSGKQRCSSPLAPSFSPITPNCSLSVRIFLSLSILLCPDQIIYF